MPRIVDKTINAEPPGAAANTNLQRALALAKERGVLRPRDLDDAGIPRDYLWRLHKAGRVERLERGLYIDSEIPFTENRDLAMVAKRVPHGVFCLLSALRFHEMTTQNPFEVWLALPRGARLPEGGWPPIRPFAVSPPFFDYGIEEHVVEGVAVRVYNPARTVADCFRYRNKIGLDVALEALRDCWRGRRATMGEIWEAAKVCQMTNVMRPYLESLL